MKFEWDADKAASNFRKHGVSFEEATEIFTAPAIFEDLGHSEREARYIAIGFSTKSRLLTVIFTRRRPDVYRIISARKSTRNERKHHAEAQSQN